MRKRLVGLCVVCVCLGAWSAQVRAQPSPSAAGDPVMEKYLNARGLVDKGTLGEAIPILEDLVANHREHEVAAYSVNLLLDSLNRLQKYDQMGRWVDRLLADEAFLESDAQLAEQLAMLKRQFLRKQAEGFEKDKKYDAAGKAYLDIFNRDPAAPRGDELLYNAGVAFEMAHSVGAAVAALELLVLRFPKSRLSQRAMLRLAGLYRRIVFYERAAELYARYARRYGGEPDAVDALGEAIRLYYGLGDFDRGRALTELFAKHYGRRLERRSARLAFHAIEHGEAKPDATIELLERYLRKWGRAGDRELLVVANARLGELLWQRSCTRGGNAQSGCVRSARASGKRQCERGAVVTVLPRVKRDTERARKAFETAVKVYPTVARGTSSAPTLYRALADEAYAKARFYLAERDYEEFLGLGIPGKLDFDPRDKKKAAESMRRFNDWLERKRAIQARLAYEAIILMGAKAGPWSTAAAARTGQLSLSFAADLLTSDIPAEVRKGKLARDKTQRYCSELRRVAEGIHETAAAAFRSCMQTVESRPRFNRWYSVCQRELERWRPKDYPVAREIYRGADHLGPVVDLEGVLR